MNGGTDDGKPRERGSGERGENALRHKGAGAGCEWDDLLALLVRQGPGGPTLAGRGGSDPQAGAPVVRYEGEALGTSRGQGEVKSC